jgi:hypothetical protein
MSHATKFSLIITFLAAAIFTGCSSYHAGPASPALAESIWVAPVVNETEYPQLGSVLAEKTREAFLHDTQTRLERRDNADVWLEITVKGFEREGRVRGVNVKQADSKNGVKTVEVTKDTGLFKAYNIVIRARAVLTDRNNKVLSDREFEATAQALPNPYGMTNADDERLLMPIVANTLARQIHESVAQLWDASPDK